jgi:predicted phosphodiesterase
MRLLLFSDLHADAGAAGRLVERARDVDVLVGAGDFGNMRRELALCIDVLRTIEKPTMLVAGNNESTCAAQQAVVGTSPVVNAGPAGIEWVLEAGAFL